MPPLKLHIIIVGVLASLTCKPLPDNLCPGFEVAEDEADNENDAGAEAWYGEMVSNFNTGTMLPPDEIRDCREKLVQSPDDSCGPSSPSARLPARPLTEDDIVRTRRPGNEFLLWTQVHHFDDGTALGPVAVARRSRRGVHIAALGSLHAAARHARLRIEPLGDGLVLVAEGSACRTEEDCIPITRIVPFVDQKFFDQPMRLPDGQCAGPATFPLVAREDVVLDPTKTRQFRLQRNIVIKDGLGVIHEEAVATDIDPDHTDVPGVEFRRESRARELLLERGSRTRGDHTPRLTIQDGIWENFIAKHGSVRPSDHPPTDPQEPLAPRSRAP